MHRCVDQAGTLECVDGSKIQGTIIEMAKFWYIQVLCMEYLCGGLFFKPQEKKQFQFNLK